MPELIPHLIVSVSSFFLGVGCTVTYYKLNGKDIVLSKPWERYGQKDS